ncbi:putative hydrolase [Xylaria sp. CBS 124048]|nr:putative hydrolase [Xylaria sp. CBS 124048]
MSFTSCCFKTFDWDGTPSGTETKLNNNDCYVTGDNKDAAVLFIHDVFGWKYRNNRLLADHYAREANVTVYVPDFFHGWVVDYKLVEEGRFHEIDLKTFAADNARPVRGPEIEAAAKTLKGELGYKRLAAVGFCYGGWAVCELASKKHTTPLIDAASLVHPSWMTEADIDNLAVPVQFLAPEIDQTFTPELKAHAFATLVKSKLPFEYVHYPNITHGNLVRGSQQNPLEREAMASAKNSASAWFRKYLH